MADHENIEHVRPHRADHVTFWRSLLAGVLLTLAFIGFGVLRYPMTLRENGVLSVAAPILLLLIYGAVGWRALRRPDRANPVAARLGLSFGLAVGALWVIQIIIENVVDTEGRINGPLALATYGLLFVLYVLAGLRGARITGRVRTGVLASVWSGMLSSVIAFAAALLVNYAFLETLRHNRLIYQDFVQSRMHDLTAFTIQDTLGGGFFHLLLLGVILGAGWGLLGGEIGCLLHRRPAAAPGGDPNVLPATG